MLINLRVQSAVSRFPLLHATGAEHQKRDEHQRQRNQQNQKIRPAEAHLYAMVVYHVKHVAQLAVGIGRRNAQEQTHQWIDVNVEEALYLVVCLEGRPVRYEYRIHRGLVVQITMVSIYI